MTTPVAFYHITWCLPSGVDVNEYYVDTMCPPELVDENDGECYYMTSCYFDYYTYNKDSVVCEDLVHLDYFTDKFRNEYDKLSVGCVETSCAT